MNNDYKEHATADPNLNSTYMVTGTNISIISARVSYVYNLLGPAITLDTACSSSLVAVNLGSQALKLGKILLYVLRYYISGLYFAKYLPFKYEDLIYKLLCPIM